MPEQGRYMYAVTRGLGAPAFSSTGLRDQPLRVVGHRGLDAVVSDVDLDEFGEDGLRRHLEDLSWLEEVARCHDAVVQECASFGTVAPLRLATICIDDEAVQLRLEQWHDALTTALDRVEGRMEWSVKAYSRASAPADRGTAMPDTGSGSGASYLQRKRAQALDRRTSEQRAIDVADEVHRSMAEHAVASRRLPPQDPRLSGHTGTMTLNGAYLVAVDDSAAFEAAGNELRERHLDAGIEVQGPWPPYSFATLEQT